MPSHTPKEKRKKRKRLGKPRGHFVEKDRSAGARALGRKLATEVFSGAARTLGIAKKVNHVKPKRRAR